MFKGKKVWSWNNLFRIFFKRLCGIIVFNKFLCNKDLVVCEFLGMVFFNVCLIIFLFVNVI